MMGGGVTQRVGEHPPARGAEARQGALRSANGSCSLKALLVQTKWWYKRRLGGPVMASQLCARRGQPTVCREPAACWPASAGHGRSCRRVAPPRLPSS